MEINEGIIMSISKGIDMDEIDNELQKQLCLLMDYSYDYGTGKMPSSENPPLLVARKVKQSILSLIHQAEIKARIDELARLLNKKDEPIPDLTFRKIKDRIAQLGGKEL